MSDVNEPTEMGVKILYYLDKCGPAYIKKLAELLQCEQPPVKQTMDSLVKDGLAERVTGTNISYKAGKRGKVTKHMNHTYFQPTRKGRHFVRALTYVPDIPLIPPYKRAAR